MFLTTEYTLLELEYKRSKTVSPRLGTDFSLCAITAKEIWKSFALAHLPLGSNVWDATSCITPLEYGSSTNDETL